MAELPILVIGGGPAGLEASRGIAELGYKAVLVEMRTALGGTPIHSGYAAFTPDFRSAEEAMGEMIAAVAGQPNVDVRLATQVSAARGRAGDFEVTLLSADGPATLRAGAVIIATGFKHFDPGRET